MYIPSFIIASVDLLVFATNDSGSALWAIDVVLLLKQPHCVIDKTYVSLSNHRPHPFNSTIDGHDIEVSILIPCPLCHVIG